MFLTEPDLYRRKTGRGCRRTFDGTGTANKVKNEQRVRIPLKVTAWQVENKLQVWILLPIEIQLLIKLWEASPMCRRMLHNYSWNTRPSQSCHFYQLLVFSFSKIFIQGTSLEASQDWPRLN